MIQEIKPASNPGRFSLTTGDTIGIDGLWASGTPR